MEMWRKESVEECEWRAAIVGWSGKVEEWKCGDVQERKQWHGGVDGRRVGSDGKLEVRSGARKDGNAKEH